jgi:hypothetical protein
VIDVSQNTNGNVLRHIRVGGVEATIWKNVYGEKTSFSVTLQRSYKDKSGEWKTTYSLRQNDLPKALLALQKAFEHVALSRVE